MSQKPWKAKNKSGKQQPFWERKSESFANVDIGQSIKCVECHAPRYQARFSNSQLNEYRQQVARERRGGPVAKLPRCITCTPQPLAELYCSDCRVTKETDCFSKAQRKNPDNARCILCVQEMLDREAPLAAAEEEERIREEDRLKASNQTNIGVSSSVTGSRSRSETQSANDGEVYLPDERDSAWAGGSVRSPSPTNTEMSIPRTIATTSSTSGPGSRSNFAKQGAYKPPIQARVQNRMEREAQQQKEIQMAGKGGNSDDEPDSEWEL